MIVQNFKYIPNPGNILKGVGLVRHYVTTSHFAVCKIISFQNGNSIFVNRQEMTFFGAQKRDSGAAGGVVFS